MISAFPQRFKERAMDEWLVRAAKWASSLEERMSPAEANRLGFIRQAVSSTGRPATLTRRSS